MKKDTVTITIIILSIILLFAIFSINKKEPTKKTTKKAYEQIEEESNNIDKNKRNNLQEITLEQYEEIVNKKTTHKLRTRSPVPVGCFHVRLRFLFSILHKREYKQSLYKGEL